ncbi:MAG: MarR family transcriptional regulator [Rubrivivax sp.]|nr:MAG: MarR family transcriptional regulator [Rubrivivax sp.]
MSKPSMPASDSTGGFYRAQGYCSEESVGFLMRRIMLSLVTDIDRRLEKVELTHAQWTPLFVIAQGKAATLAELSRELQIDAGALTRTLDRLEAKGLCRRVRSTQDRRVAYLELTDEGKAAAAQVPVVLSEVLNAYLQDFSRDEWQLLLGMLRRMLVNAEAFRQPHDEDEAPRVSDATPSNQPTGV